MKLQSVSDHVISNREERVFLPRYWNRSANAISWQYPSMWSYYFFMLQDQSSKRVSVDNNNLITIKAGQERLRDMHD